MNFPTVLLVLFQVSLSWNRALGVELRCDFVSSAHGYGCETDGVFKEDAAITSISGNHFYGHNNSLVEYFKLLEESETHFVPHNIGVHFPKLQKIFLHGEKLQAISRSVFHRCDGVSALFVTGTKILWLPEDTFNDLPKLEILVLRENQIKLLPMKLFTNNGKLHRFSADGNKIQVIDLQFGESLKFVNLERNVCINETKSSKVEEINEKIRENCFSSKLNDMHNRIKRLEQEVTEKTEDLKLLEQENLENLQSTSEFPYDDSEDADDIEDDLLLHNVIKMNLTFCLNDVKTARTFVSSLERDVATQKEEISELLKNISSLEQENLNLSQSLNHSQVLNREIAEELARLNLTIQTQEIYISELVLDISELQQKFIDETTEFPSTNESFEGCENCSTSTRYLEAKTDASDVGSSSSTATPDTDSDDDYDENDADANVYVESFSSVNEFVNSSESASERALTISDNEELRGKVDDLTKSLNESLTKVSKLDSDLKLKISENENLTFEVETLKTKLESEMERQTITSDSVAAKSTKSVDTLEATIDNGQKVLVVLAAVALLATLVSIILAVKLMKASKMSPDGGDLYMRTTDKYKNSTNF